MAALVVLVSCLCPVKNVCFKALSCDCVLELAQGCRNKPEAGALASDMCLDAAEAHSADARGASASNRHFYRRKIPSGQLEARACLVKTAF